MGKPNKKTDKVAKPSSTLDRPTKKEILELCNQLLEKCIEPISSGAREWDDFLEIHSLVEKIRDRQKNLTTDSEPHDRDEEWPPFLKWLEENGVDHSLVAVEEFPGYGYGLKATTDIKKDDLLLSIPRKIIMSVESAQKSQMGPLIEEDQILRAMPNVVLVMYLLNESKDPNSFWQPYIKSLPPTYNTTLYFSLDELKLLKGSPVLTDALNHYQSIARQYAYFYKRFQNNHFASKVPLLRDGFTYDSYRSEVKAWLKSLSKHGASPRREPFISIGARWAVSSVTTRLNQVPSSSDGNQMSYALIPLWDMCNHHNGKLSTDFDVAKNCSKCYAMDDFDKDNQIFIFYGSRPNSQLLLHNGFVYPDNVFDYYDLKLGVSRSDPLFSLKTKVLALALIPIIPFQLRPGSQPVTPDLLAYLRVTCMEESKLQELLEAGDSDHVSSSLRDEDVHVSAENELKVWNFLCARVELLLRFYPTSLDADRVQIELPESNDRNSMALQLVIGEKKILDNTLMYAMSKKLALS